MKLKTLSSLILTSLFPASALLAVDYEKDVEPILRVTCYECHGSKEKGDLRMDQVEKFSERIGEGTFSEDDFVIYPGHPEKSELIKKVTETRIEDRMPPPNRGKDPLTSKEIAILKDWIKAGASFEAGDVPVPEPTLDKTALHTWISASTGGELKAYFVKVDGDNIVLRSESGQEKPFPASAFAEESIELAKQLHALE